jgi:hypothetical protein
MKRLIVVAFLVSLFLASAGEANAFFFRRTVVVNNVVNNVVPAPAFIPAFTPVFSSFSAVNFTTGFGFPATTLAVNNGAFFGSGFYGARFGGVSVAAPGVRVAVGSGFRRFGGVRVGVGVGFRRFR